MKIAVLADIHGNYIALRDCVSYARSQGVDAFIFLGDYLGELAYPERTMQILYQLAAEQKCYFIRGNKEEYWLNYKKNGERGWNKGDSTTGSLLYTYNHLTESDLEFFQNLKISDRLEFAAMPAFMICHGAPFKVNQKLLEGDERTAEAIEMVDTSLIICAHTHLQKKFTFNNKVVINPGSVGVPLLSQGKTQFMLLEDKDGTWSEEFISLPYDYEKVISELQESGLDIYAPYWCMVTKKLLQDGCISHGTVLEEAMTLCKEENGHCVWPNVPKKYWEMAVRKFEIGGAEFI